MLGKVIGISKTVANNLDATTEGYVLDARQGKVLNDKIIGLARFFGGPTAVTAVSIAAAPTEKNSYIFTVTASFSCGGVTVPQYSKGIYITNGAGDGTLMAVDTDGNIITAFRSSGTWESGKTR